MVTIWIEYPPSYDLCYAVDFMKFPEVMTSWQIYIVDLSKNWKTLIEFVSQHNSSYSFITSSKDCWNTFFFTLDKFFYSISWPLLLPTQKPIRGQSTYSYFYYLAQLATTEPNLSPSSNLGDCCFLQDILDPRCPE